MKVKEIILESSYDGMIASMKTKYPDWTDEIIDQVKWAKNNLKRDDRVAWYLKIVRANIEGNIESTMGDYQFSSFNKLRNDILHFFGYESNDIQNYQFRNQTVSQVIVDLGNFERTFQAKQDKVKPVTPQSGDREIIKFPDGSAWWFVDRGYCSDEGRSGGHCGNINGKHNSSERILSYRINGHVQLTFILLPNGKLGEMKAKHNQKPAEKFHPQIMSLLLDPIVKGIKGAGYAPWMNFSVFDLHDNNISELQQKKPILITDQIKAEPSEFLKAPDIIKSNTKYQNIAISKIPALRNVINDNSIQGWESAIEEDPKLLIYATPELPDFEKRVVDTLVNNPQLILRCNKSILDNYELMKSVIENDMNGTVFQYILPNNKHYTKLCKLAVTSDGWALEYVPNELITPELCKLAVTSHGTALEYVPEEYRTLELCKLGVKSDGMAMEYVPIELKQKVRDLLNKTNESIQRLTYLTNYRF